MKKLLQWVWLLNKRLLKRPVFLIILLLIPALVLGYGSVANEQSGMLTVVLAQEGDDPLATQVMEDLKESSQLIAFKILPSPEAAVEQVRLGKADSAWIFPDELAEKAEIFAADPGENNAFVRVVEREDNVMLMLAREKLSGQLYELCARTVYMNFVRSHIPEMENASDEELLELYEKTDITTELFNFETADGKVVELGQTNYLLSPLRGLLGVITVLCALAAAMYHIRDTQHGTFAWVPLHLRPLAELGCQMVAVVDIGIVSLVSLSLVGQTQNLLREILVLVMYGLCASVFAMMLRRLCGTVRALGAALPLLVVAMLLLCPVFFDLAAVKQLQFLFPPTYYINAVIADRYLWYMPVYTLICGGVYLLAGKVLRRD